jgi:hypothetical protein
MKKAKEPVTRDDLIAQCEKWPVGKQTRNICRDERTEEMGPDAVIARVMASVPDKALNDVFLMNLAVLGLSPGSSEWRRFEDARDMWDRNENGTSWSVTIRAMVAELPENIPQYDGDTIVDFQKLEKE